MGLVCLGVNHKTAPVEVRERFAFSKSALEAALQEVAGGEGIDETVVLSTCNRVEVYAVCESSDAGLAHLEGYLRDHFGVEKGEVDLFYRLRDGETARHLFRVASGLDSMVLGETEIFGQVKKAYAAAHGAGVTSRLLNKLFQHSFKVGKAVRSSTHIARGATSVGSVAVDLAEKIFGDLGKCQVMVLGAGDMSRRTAQSLMSRGAKSIIVSNRSYDKAEELAVEMGGEAIRFDDWAMAIPKVDIVISSTGAPHTVIHPDDVQAAMRRRRGRPLFVIDIAVPRDVEAGVNELENVYLYDIDALEAIAAEGRREREAQIKVCDAMIEEHMGEMDVPGLGSGGEGRGREEMGGEYRAAHE
ncbi:MAG: glutamyl-tRNA reductase [Verrucomicrobiota bacterium]